MIILRMKRGKLKMNGKIAKSELKSIKSLNDSILINELMKEYRKRECFGRDWLFIIMGFIGLVIAPMTILVALIVGKITTNSILIASVGLAAVSFGIWLAYTIVAIGSHKRIKNRDIDFVTYVSTNKCLSTAKYQDINDNFTKKRCAMFHQHKVEMLYDVDYDRLTPGTSCILLCEKRNPKYAVIDDFAGIRLSQPRRKLTQREKRIKRSEQIKRSMNTETNKRLVYRREDDTEMTKAFNGVH